MLKNKASNFRTILHHMLQEKKKKQQHFTSKTYVVSASGVYFSPQSKRRAPCQVGHWAKQIGSQLKINYVIYKMTFTHWHLIITRWFADIKDLSCVTLGSLLHLSGWNKTFCISFLFFSDAPKEQSVFIMLNGEESELCFINLANTKVRGIISFFWHVIIYFT